MVKKTWVGRTEVDILEDEIEDREGDGELEEAVETPAPETPAPEDVAVRGQPRRGDQTLQRRRRKTRQLQRGFWMQVRSPELHELLQRSRQFLEDRGAREWQVVPKGSEIGRDWIHHESGQSDVKVILGSLNARRLRKPQPLLSPVEAPLRKSCLLLRNGTCLTTDWEDWHQLTPSSQTRPLVSQREVCIILYGKPVGEVEDEEAGDPRFDEREQLRKQKWDSLPRELKLALRRIHVNLGHASTAQMLRAMRISRASEVAIRACRLFRCPDCPRIQLPKQPRPAKLPLTEEFNIHIGVDVLQAKDADGNSWSWLNILCQGTSFQVCVLLHETSFNPTAAACLQAFEQGWTSWAGYPEYGVFTDRAKYFLGEFSEAMAHEGCVFDSAAKASPWQLGQVERHGRIWKSILKRIVWSDQLAGKDHMIHATAAVNAAKNALTRRSGFSPQQQWVLGKSIRLPADITDDGEAVRLGSIALTTTPSSRFYLKSKLRFSAREAFVKVSNSEALKRAELRKIKPFRGALPVGSYVFYYDAADQVPGPSCWRGIARITGHEGSHTVWISHRGLILAVSPEHLAKAFTEEMEQWTTMGSEIDLLDAQPVPQGFIDLRKNPTPPTDGFPEEIEEEQNREQLEQEVPEEDPGYLPTSEEGEKAEAPRGPVAEAEMEDLSSGSTSMARIRLESERERKRQMKSPEFFDSVTQLQSGSEPSAVDIPVPEDDVFDPDLHDYHQSRPSKRLPAISEGPETESAEREAKRLRGGEVKEEQESGLFAYLVVEKPGHLLEVAKRTYLMQEDAFLALDVTLDDFMFGVKRNLFDDKFENMYAYAMTGGDGNASAIKKRGRKEIRLQDLSDELKQMFVGPDGADHKEWRAWLDKEAVEVVDTATSRDIRQNKPDLIVPTRWVRTNKNDGMENAEFKAKSRLVVQGFKDKSLGYYRRDAPTASALAESITLAVSAYMGFTLISKDVKNAYFSGKSLDRDIYLEQPRGGLKDLQPGCLLRAKKAIYGFSEAARLFWVALKGHLESDGWQESRLEPAMFYLSNPKDNTLKGILVTHVDDVEGGVEPRWMQRAFEKSSQALGYATNHFKEFVFRGRELKQHSDGHIDVAMRNYTP